MTQALRTFCSSKREISTWVFYIEKHPEKFLESGIFGILETESVTEIGAPLYKVSSYLDF